MSEEGKFASCVYIDEDGQLQSEFEYICLYESIHQSLIFEGFILNGVSNPTALEPPVEGVHFLSSYQEFDTNKDTITELISAAL